MRDLKQLNKQEKIAVKDENPFRMRKLKPEGPYVMGHEQCTERRVEYLKRGNRILTTYSTVAAFSNLGLQHINSLNKSNDTPFRLTIGARLIEPKLSDL